MPNILSQEIKDAAPYVHQFLDAALSNNKLAQAYVFTGTNAELKKTVVYEITKILNCEQNKDIYSVPCGQCTNCLWLSDYNHPETPLVVDPVADEESKKNTITLGKSKELIQRLQKSSQFHRVIYFPHAEKEYWEIEAVNALLKTIEEFQAKVLFIFDANSSEHVLETILSRCQIVHFPFQAAEERDHSVILEKLNGLFQKKMNYFEIVQIAETLEAEDIDLLSEFFADQYVKDHNSFWKYCIDQSSDALKKLKAFCNKRLVVEEMLVNINQLVS